MQGYSGSIGGVNWKTTFSQNVKFRCQHCGYCCINSNVLLTKEDMKRFRGETKKDYIELSKQGFRIVDTDRKECLFHKNSRCSIYSIRPAICREYPFKVTFLSKNTAYIDLIYSCPAVIKKDFDEINRIDFNELVKNKKSGLEIEFELAGKERDMEKKLNSRRWEEQIEKLNNLRDLLDLFAVFSPGEKPNFDFFIKKFYTIYVNYLENNPPYQAINLKNNRLYFIDSIKIGRMERKKMDSEAKRVFIDYLKNFFRRKTTVLDFYCGLTRIKMQGKRASAGELQREVARRIILPLQFFALVISEKNKSETITERDAKETIFALDCSLFTPMDSIMPGVMRKTKFFD